VDGGAAARLSAFANGMQLAACAGGTSRAGTTRRFRATRSAGWPPPTASPSA